MSNVTGLNLELLQPKSKKLSEIYTKSLWHIQLLLKSKITHNLKSAIASFQRLEKGDVQGKTDISWEWREREQRETYWQTRETDRRERQTKRQKDKRELERQKRVRKTEESERQKRVREKRVRRVRKKRERE